MKKKKGTQIPPSKFEQFKALYDRHAKTYSILAVGVLFAILFIVRVNDIRMKSQMHADEIFSVMLSTCNDYYTTPLPNGEYSGEELKNIIVKDDIGGIKGAISDIAQLWVNNGDIPHASLYYMTLRLTLIGFDTFDIDELSWRGGILNLIFFALSFFFMYKLLKCIFKDRQVLILCGLAIAFGNFMSISNTLLLREYQMAETGIIALTYVAVKLIYAFRENRNVSQFKYVLGLSLLVAYVISLGYLNAIYIFFLAIALIFAAIHYRHANWILLFLLSGLLAIGVAYVLYPGFFNFMLHETVHKAKAFSNFGGIWNILFVRDIALNFFTFYGTVIFIIIILGILASKQRKYLLKSDLFLWLPIISLCSMVLIVYASVLKMPRYYYPVLPIFSLIVPQLIAILPKAWKGYFDVLVLSYFTIIACVFPLKVNYGWTELTRNLNQETQIFNLNPNEIVQLVPCMNDTLNYHVINNDYVSINKEGKSYVITKENIDIDNDSISSIKKLILGRQIYLYQFKFQRNEKQ